MLRYRIFASCGSSIGCPCSYRHLGVTSCTVKFSFHSLISIFLFLPLCRLSFSWIHYVPVNISTGLVLHRYLHTCTEEFHNFSIESLHFGFRRFECWFLAYLADFLSSHRALMVSSQIIWQLVVGETSGSHHWCICSYAAVDMWKQLH
jgi:hypothetical protein